MDEGQPVTGSPAPDGHPEDMSKGERAEIRRVGAAGPGGNPMNIHEAVPLVARSVRIHEAFALLLCADDDSLVRSIRECRWALRTDWATQQLDTELPG